MRCDSLTHSQLTHSLTEWRRGDGEEAAAVGGECGSSIARFSKHTPSSVQYSHRQPSTIPIKLQLN